MTPLNKISGYATAPKGQVLLYNSRGGTTLDSFLVSIVVEYRDVLNTWANTHTTKRN